MDPRFDLLLRLLVAGVLTGLLGWERESAGKSAGLRTYMMVGVGSALFCVVGELLIREQGPVGMSYDPIRLVQAIATGVGFLGAGTIFVQRKQGEVHGLTTAAGIWVAAAVGMASGLRYYVIAGGATLLVLLILRLVSRLERRLRP